MSAVITPEDFARELNKLAEGYKKKSKFAGDRNWQRAQNITNNGDHINGYDDGEAPQ